MASNVLEIIADAQQQTLAGIRQAHEASAAAIENSVGFAGQIWEIRKDYNQRILSAFGLAPKA